MLLVFIVDPVSADDAQGKVSIFLKKGQLHVNVKQMSLQSAIKKIARKKHFLIHDASALPENTITAHCKASNLKLVLECLLDNKADLVVRYQRSPKSKGSKTHVAEAWVMPYDTYSPQTTTSQTVSTTPAQNCVSPDTVASPSIHQVTSDQTELLLQRAQSSDPEIRAAATATLLRGADISSPSVKAIMERALNDEDEEVRAQAISILAERGGEAASTAIHQGMQDTSEDVRLQAVDAIKDDSALLQQALKDKDEAVRSLAEAKLQQLIYQGQNTGSPALVSNDSLYGGN